MKRKFLLLALMCLTLMGGVKFNALNAQTEPITRNETSSITISNGTESTSGNYPIHTQKKYTHSQQIYTSAELASMSNNYITHITYFTTNTKTGTFKNVSVYMQNTTKSKFDTTGDWVKGGFTLVYEGEVKVENGEMVIKLDDSFYYESGKNLLIYIDIDNNASTAVSYPWKKFQTTYSSYTNLTYYSSSNGYGTDGNTWSNSNNSQRTSRNIIKFTYTDKIDTTIDKPEFFDPEVYSWYYTPQNNAKDILTTKFMFTAKNTTDYQIILSTASDLSNPRYIAGGESTWAKVTDEQINEGIVCVETDVISDLESGIDYYWQVKAMNVSGNMKSDVVESAIFKFTTKKVSAPEAATYTNPANGVTLYDFPELSWEYADNTAEYRLLLGESEEFSLNENIDNNDIEVNWTTANALGSGSYQTSRLAAGTYYWRVDVKNTAGTTEGEPRSFTLSAPNNISNAKADVNNKTLSWTFAEGTTHYRVLLGKKVNDELELLWHVGNANNWVETNGNIGTAIIPENLDANTEYYWAVDVKNPIGQKIYWFYVDDLSQPIYDSNGKFTGEYRQKVEPQVDIHSFISASLSSVKNTAPTNGEITEEVNPILTWSYVGDATEYKVFLGTDENNLKAETEEWLPRESVETGGIAEYKANGSYQTEGLTAATKYFWRVDVRNDKHTATGNVCSFVATLPVTTVVAYPDQILPLTTTGGKGSTEVNWILFEKAVGYNIYLDDKQLNKELVTERPFTISGLEHNMEKGYNIYVEADYGELGKTMSEPFNVKVSGKGTFSVAVFKNNKENRLEGATVTLTFVKDEFERTPSGDGITTEYVYQTNQYGQAYVEQTINGTTSQTTNFSLINGTYKYKVEKTDYTTEEGSFVIENDESYPLSVTLTSNNIFEVTISDESFYSVKINLATNKYGNYHVYLVKNGTQQYLGEKTFDLNQDNTSVSWTYTDWANLGKGSYQFCVSTREGGELNWNKEGVIMRYDVFDGSGDWTNTSCWRDNELPKETDDVYILANAEIAKGSDIKVGNVYIEQNNQTGSSLTINGSLTAKMVYNNAKASSLCINEGGQLRQNNEELNGKFVMTVTPPTSWDESNIDGWQFIASPVKGVEFSKFVPANEGQGDYDLYQYDGENNKWRNHKHVYGEGEEAFDFGKTFELGTAYLAALQYEKDVTFSGVLNAAQTYAFNVSHNAEKNAANYHLLGNPFTFAMDVKNFKATGLATGYAVLNAEGNDYLYLIKGQIPVGNGFFVMATEATASLTYSETAARGAAEETANINIVAKGATGSNNVIINMANDKEGFRKLEGFNKEIANIYVENKGNKYAIYNCESDVNEVELTFVAKQMGSYSLSFDINGEFETVTLVDRMTGVETDMIAEGEYNFIATSNDMKNRFVVRLSNSMTATEEFLANFVYQSGEELIINAEGAIQIIDMMGRVVYSNENANGNDRINVSEFNNAAYVVRVINSNGVKSQKVVIY